MNVLKLRAFTSPNSLRETNALMLRTFKKQKVLKENQYVPEDDTKHLKEMETVWPKLLNTMQENH